jgi:hypothetical protein
MAELLPDEKRVAPSVGPWEVQEILDSREFDEECAKVLLIHGPGGDIAYAAHYSSNGSTAKQQANARLIAAAPELLAVLHEGRRAIGDHFAPNDCYATGPMTGDAVYDLVMCPACSFIAKYDVVLAKLEGRS